MLLVRKEFPTPELEDKNKHLLYILQILDLIFINLLHTALQFLQRTLRQLQGLLFLRQKTVHVDLDIQTSHFWLLNILLKHPHQLILNSPLYAQFFVKVTFEHCLHNKDVRWHTDSVALEFVEVLHGLRIPVSSDNDLDILGKDSWQPECDISLTSIIFVNEVIDSFEDKNDLVVEDIQVFDCLVFNPLVADVQPVSKIFSQFLVMQLHLLIYV